MDSKIPHGQDPVYGVDPLAYMTLERFLQVSDTNPKLEGGTFGQTSRVSAAHKTSWLLLLYGQSSLNHTTCTRRLFRLVNKPTMRIDKGGETSSTPLTPGIASLA